MSFFLKKISLYFILVFLLNIILGLCLKNYESNDLKKAEVLFADLRWDDYKTLSDSLDVLVLGSSHALRSFHPKVIQQELDIQNKVFNFGSIVQTPITSYFILNEVLKKHQPKVIIFEIYVMVYKSDNQLNIARYNFQPMPWEDNKWAFLKDGFSFTEKIPLLFFPTYVHRRYFKNIINKLCGRNHLPSTKSHYDHNGYVFDDDTVSTKKLYLDNQFNQLKVKKSELTAKNIEYTKKIVERCRTANIPIIFMTSPLPEFSIGLIEEYHDTFKVFDSLAQELNVPYIDFNIKRIPEIKDTLHYFDDDHLNLEGAKIFSKKISPIIKNYIYK